MATKTLDLLNVITPDQMACEIARKQHEWSTYLAAERAKWTELRNYIFATDTSTTSNKTLPWRNSTTIPKLCQIRDNLFSNYMAVMFPKRKSIDWLADNKDSSSVDKRNAIINYMSWCITQPRFKPEIAKCVLDYIETGNAFAMPEWLDFRQDINSEVKTGFVGPTPRRISPLDICFNPTAPSFLETPKIIRSMVTLGELKKKLNQMSNDENRDAFDALFKYMIEYRTNIRQSGMDLTIQDEWYAIDGFSSFRAYLDSDYAEVLTFYGDIYDIENNELLENHVIMVVDRHKIIIKKPNPSGYGVAPIFHVGWRVRQDNLWAMGPLANLVGMQYRIDHIENMQADVLDLITVPMLKIKGYVEDFEWKPMGRIVTSEEGDVQMLAPPFQVLQIDNKIAMYQSTMEEMAGSPKEAAGFRTPGEKTAFEVSRLENAAARIFQNKIQQFEELFLEPLLNSMLEMARRQIQGPQEINIFDNEFNFQQFMTLTSEDITGAGRIKPIAARHFAEKNELIQNLTNLYSTLMQSDPDLKLHFSAIQLSTLLQDALDLSDYQLVRPFVRIFEQQDAQKFQQAGQVNGQMEAMTPTGFTPDDASQPFAGPPGAQPAPGTPGPGIPVGPAPIPGK